MRRGHYRHQPLVDLNAPLPKQTALPPGPLHPEAQANAVKRQPYDELYVKLKAQRDYWNPNS